MTVAFGVVTDSMSAMPATADQFRHVAAGFTSRVEGVSPDGWESPSPCDGWTARDVVAHVIDAAGRYFELVGEDRPAGPGVTEDPKGAWAATCAEMQAALEDPQRATKEYDGLMGRTSFEDGVRNLLCFDLLVHAWDLARATGQDERLDPDDVRSAFAFAEPMDEMLRTSGACGPKIEPPAGADEQTRFLSFLGRAV